MISVSKTDLGRYNKYKHHLHLKDHLQVYHKQFQLKPEHKYFVEQSLKELLKLGVVNLIKTQPSS